MINLVLFLIAFIAGTGFYKAFAWICSVSDSTAHWAKRLLVSIVATVLFYSAVGCTVVAGGWV